MSWGSGYFGQLGHGLDKVYCSTPTVIDRLMPRYTGGHPVKVVAGGMQSAVIVVDDLDQWRERERELEKDQERVRMRTRTRGRNASASASSASSSSPPSPSAVPKFETRVFRFGSNKYGQCAVEGGKCNAIAYPTPMIDVYHPETYRKVTFVDLALGKLHSVGLALSGELYSWGSTASGRCGHGDSSSITAATMRGGGVPVGGGHGGGHVLVTENGMAMMNAATTTTSTNYRNNNHTTTTTVIRSAMRMRNGISLPKRIDALRNVKIIQITSGDAHNLALSRSGRVFAWGNNASGQLGVGHVMHLMSPRLIADLEFGQHQNLMKMVMRRKMMEMGAAGAAGGASASGETGKDPNADLSDTGYGSAIAMSMSICGKGELSQRAEQAPDVNINFDADLEIQPSVEDNFNLVPENESSSIPPPPPPPPPMVSSPTTNHQNSLGAALAPIHYPASPHKKATQRVGGTGTTMSHPPTTNPTSTIDNHNTTTEPIIPPIITSIHAAGAYSAAVSSTGDVYTWGCGEGNQLGHPMPPAGPLSPLPHVESGSSTMTTTTTTTVNSSGSNINNSSKMRIRDGKSFDSRLNVLIPRRVECVRELGLRVNDLVTSSNFMLAVCEREEKSAMPAASTGVSHAAAGVKSSTRNTGVGEEEFDESYLMGKTLYELQLERNEKGLDRIRLYRGPQK